MKYLQFETQETSLLTLTTDKAHKVLFLRMWLLWLSVRYLDNKTYYADVWHVRSNNNKPVSAMPSSVPAPRAGAHLLISLENTLPSYQPAWLHCDWVLN